MRREVALVVPPATGGITAHARSLMHRLPALGWSVRVCAPAPVLALLVAGATRTPPHVTLVAVRWPVEPWRAAVDRGARGDLSRALGGVDAVSAQGLRAGGAALAADAGISAGAGIGRAGGAAARAPFRGAAWAGRPGRRPGTTPLVVTWHNPPPSTGAAGFAGRLLAHRVARGATLTLAASTDLLAAARAAGAGRARLLEVAAPVGRPGDPARARVIRRTLVPDGRPLVFTAGRLAVQKDHASAVRAVARLPAGHRPVLAVAGDGPERGRLTLLAADLGVDLVLLGERSDVADLLLAADVALLCSRWEARSLFAQEALRAGTPLVTTAVGGLPELVGAAAVVVNRSPGPPRSAHGGSRGAGDVGAAEPDRLATDLAAALDGILGDRRESGRLAAAGRRRAAQWPDEDDTARAVAAALDAALLLVWDSVER